MSDPKHASEHASSPEPREAPRPEAKPFAVEAAGLVDVLCEGPLDPGMPLTVCDEIEELCRRAIEMAVTAARPAAAAPREETPGRWRCTLCDCEPTDPKCVGQHSQYHTWEPPAAPRKGAAFDASFLQGLAVGLAVLAREYDRPMLAADILRGLGVTLADLRRAKVDTYDLDPLRAEMEQRP